MECPVGTLVLAVENEAERQALLSSVITSLKRSVVGPRRLLAVITG